MCVWVWVWVWGVWGAQSLIQKINNLKAYEIPDILCDCFNVKIEQKDKETFDRIRDKRNQIAHGTKVKLCIREAIEMNNFLHDLALRIDQHLIEYFYVIESRSK